MIVVVNTLDLKDGAGNDLLGLCVPLQNGKGGQLFVGGCYGDSPAAVDGGLIHMGDDRLGKCGIGGRGAHLHKGVHSLGHVGDSDGAVRLGGLRTDNLSILDDIEHSAGEGIVAVIQLDKFHFYLGIILKHQGNVGLAVPAEGLLDLAGFRAFGVALRGRHFGGGVAADGHILPGYIRQIAALAGDIGAGKVVVHADDLNDCPGKALGGVVRVHLADAALAGDFRCVGKGDGHSLVAAIGQNNILRPRIVDLVAVRRFQFRHRIGARIQSGQGVRPVLPRHDLF